MLCDAWILTGDYACIKYSTHPAMRQFTVLSDNYLITASLQATYAELRSRRDLLEKSGMRF